jgi:hypothetical protein
MSVAGGILTARKENYRKDKIKMVENLKFD